MEQYDNIIGKIFSKIGSDSSFVLKRAFGKHYSNASIKDVIAYYDVIGGEKVNNDACFLVATMMCKYLKSPAPPTNKRTLQSSISILYAGSTETCKRKIRLLLSAEDINPVFVRTFYSICTLIQNQGIDLAKTDFYSLAHDFAVWNDSVRIKWARAITKTDQTNNTKEVSL